MYPWGVGPVVQLVWLLRHPLLKCTCLGLFMCAAGYLPLHPSLGGGHTALLNDVKVTTRLALTDHNLETQHNRT